MNGATFRAERLSARVIRIRDVLDVACYLVMGEETACLIDTGHGLGDLRSYVETLTDLPVFVILTHGHIDHANAAALWDEVWMHPADLEIYRKHSDLSFRQHELAAHEETREIPVSEYNPVRTKEFRPLHDGQLFDLGSLVLEVIHTPGHTPGMCMILIREERMILFGDGCGLEVLLIFPDSSTVSDYRRTLLKLKAYEDRYDRILRNHGTCESGKELLEHCIGCCEDILAGTDAAMCVEFGGIAALSAREVDENHVRTDGKEGNIIYTEDKRC